MEREADFLSLSLSLSGLCFGFPPASAGFRLAVAAARSGSKLDSSFGSSSARRFAAVAVRSSSHLAAATRTAAAVRFRTAAAVRSRFVVRICCLSAVRCLCVSRFMTALLVRASASTWLSPRR